MREASPSSSTSMTQARPVRTVQRAPAGTKWVRRRGSSPYFLRRSPATGTASRLQRRRTRSPSSRPCCQPSRRSTHWPPTPWFTTPASAKAPDGACDGDAGTAIPRRRRRRGRDGRSRSVRPTSDTTTDHHHRGLDHQAFCDGHRSHRGSAGRLLEQAERCVSRRRPRNPRPASPRRCSRLQTSQRSASRCRR